MDLSIESVYKLARQVYADYPVLADLATSQAILESRLLGTPSKLAVECNNLFGIKDTDKRGYKAYWTTECAKGVCRKVVQNFECYDSPIGSFEHHKWLMNRPRYRHVLNAKDFDTAAKEIYIAGYATDPLYPKKLLSIYNEVIIPMKQKERVNVNLSKS